MYNVLKFIVSLAVALVLMLVIRAYAFTLFTVSKDMGPDLKKGSRVLVNRLARKNLQKDNIIVFGDSTYSIARVAAIPGDTITLNNEQFVINKRCVTKCTCGACQTYMVVAGADTSIIEGSSVVGKAYPLRLRLFGQ